MRFGHLNARLYHWKGILLLWLFAGRVMYKDFLCMNYPICYAFGIDVADRGTMPMVPRT